MADGFSVEPGSIQDEARAFLRASRDAAAAWAQLETSLSGLGVVAGSDKPGRTFATRYEADTDTMAENMRRLARSVESVHTALGKASDNYTDVDLRNEHMLRPAGGGR